MKKRSRLRSNWDREGLITVIVKAVRLNTVHRTNTKRKIKMQDKSTNFPTRRKDDSCYTDGAGKKGVANHICRGLR